MRIIERQQLTVSVTKTNRLIPFREVIWIYFDSQAKDIEM
jgi:hypothetical protein